MRGKIGKYSIGSETEGEKLQQNPKDIQDTIRANYEQFKSIKLENLEETYRFVEICTPS